MGAGSILTALKLAWQFRFLILLTVVIGAGGWVLWRMDSLEQEAKDAREALGEAVRINGELAKTNALLEAAKAYSEQALAQKLARKSREADQLGKLVQHVMAQEKTNACVASPAIRAVLDSMREPYVSADGGVE